MVACRALPNNRGLTKHEQGGGNREAEIAEIESRLDQPGLEITEGEDVPEMRDQHIVQIVGHTPQKEQAGDQYERPPVGCRLNLRRRGSEILLTLLEAGTSRNWFTDDDVFFQAP